MPKRPYDYEDALPMENPHGEYHWRDAQKQVAKLYEVIRRDAVAHSVAATVGSARGTRLDFGTGSDAELEALRGMVIALSARCGELEELIEQHAVNNPSPTILERIQQVN